MAHAKLCVGITGPRELIENLCINHGPASLKFILMKKIGRIELESTIHVTYIDAEDHAYQDFPTPCIDLTHPGILAMNTVPQHSIEFFKKRNETLKVMDIKLSICITNNNQVFRSCFV